jgi:hypothetical protein
MRAAACPGARLMTGILRAAQLKIGSNRGEGVEKGEE